MKLFGKICLIISLVLVGISALCLGIGIALGSSFKEVRTMADAGEFNFGNWTIGNGDFYFGSGSGDIIEDSYTFAAENIEDFDMDIQYGEISFVDSDTEEVSIEIEAPDRNTYICELDGNTLRLEDKTHGYRVNFDGNDVNITIVIPRDMTFDTVKLKTDAGTLNANYAFEAEEMDVELGAGELVADSLQAKKKLHVDVGAGNVEVYDFSAKELEVDCGVGNAELTGIIEEEAKADCGVGNITLVVFGEEKDYNYEVDCGVGEVNINGNTFSSLSDKRRINNEADKDIYLDCGVGQINMKFLELGGV